MQIAAMFILSRPFVTQWQMTTWWRRQRQIWHDNARDDVEWQALSGWRWLLLSRRKQARSQLIGIPFVCSTQGERSCHTRRCRIDSTELRRFGSVFWSLEWDDVGRVSRVKWLKMCGHKIVRPMLLFFESTGSGLDITNVKTLVK